MVSVIVPVYNAQTTLSRCLDSLISQTYDNYEIILVDDGSKDMSLSICQVYANANGKIKVYHKKNGGVSSARNCGIQLAKGEWVTFCDADDWVAADWLERFVCNSHDVQLVVQSFAVINNASITSPEYYFEGDIKNGINHLYKFDMPGVLWNKMVLRDVLTQHNLLLDETLTFREDEEFLLRLYPRINTVRIINQKSYYYIAPNFDSKYRADLYYQFLRIYETLNVEFYSEVSSIKCQYIEDITKSLVESYIKSESDCYKKLCVYRTIIGRNVIECNSISVWLKFILVLPGSYLSHIFLSLFSFIRS